MDHLIQKYEETIIDERFSKRAKRTIKDMLRSQQLNRQQRDFLRNSIFKIAKEKIKDERDVAIIDWLENAYKTLLEDKVQTVQTDAYFSPSLDCRNAIIYELENCSADLKVCVFTISDDKLADAIMDCHRRNVKVRIVTDDEKTMDRGSDIHELSQAGIMVKIDHTSDHMHHKYAIIDDRVLLTGSFNWTRSASIFNYENLLFTNEQKLINQYTMEFERLWITMKRY